MDEIHDFGSLEEMIARAEIIIEATVVAVEPGRVVGPPDDPLQFQQVTLQVEDVIFGNLAATTILLEAEEYGGGQNVYPLPEVGDHGIYFIHLKRERTSQPYYGLLNSEGMFIADGDRIVASNPEDAWAREIEAMSLEDLKVRIEQLVD